MKTIINASTVAYSCNDILDRGVKVNVIEKDVPMTLIDVDGISYYVESSKLTDVNDNSRLDLVKFVKEQLGKPYVWGDEGPDSFDCSGLAYYCYKESLNIKLPRVSRDMATAGYNIEHLISLRPGDLIFFDTTGDGKINHVGIFIGDGAMIHASSSGTVREGKLTSAYWTKKIVAMRDVIGD